MPGSISEDAHTIRILISSDNHVGYNERDPIRGEDSWKTFHEVMTIAKEREVDLVLLAGDLFHENKPSRQSIYHVMKSLRETCYGDKPCELELLSDPALSLNDESDHINYEDENINVAIPVVAISGNHDDAGGVYIILSILHLYKNNANNVPPTQGGGLSALDILSASGLVNHIGKIRENDNIVLAPLVFKKGDTKLAIYGMESVREERLHRTFRDHKVKFMRPDAYRDDEYFNLMALHQNHHAHSETGYLPENFLPHFLDLVIWGHEHECLMDPVTNPETGFAVMQPGSSVVTSLCEGESVEKFVGLLSLTGKEYSVEKIKLATVRPFVMKEVIMARDCGFPATSKNRGRVIEWLTAQVEQLIDRAHEQWRGANSNEYGTPLTDEEPPLPLIRLRVEYSGGYEVENPRRFSNRFVGKVANVNDVVQFYRKKTATMTRRINEVGEEVDVIAAVELEGLRVQDLVQDFLKQHTLAVLPSAGLDDSIGQYVDKNDRHAIKTFVDETIEEQVKRLMNLGDVDEDSIEHAITARPAVGEENAGLGSKRARNADDDGGSAAGARRATGQAASTTRTRARVPDSEDEDDGFDDEVVPVPEAAPSSRSRARATTKSTPAPPPSTTTRRAPAIRDPPSRSAATRKTPAVHQSQPLFNDGSDSDDFVPEPVLNDDDEDEDEDDVMQDVESISEEEDSEVEEPAPRSRRRTNPAAPALSTTRQRKPTTPAPPSKPSTSSSRTTSRLSALSKFQPQNPSRRPAPSSSTTASSPARKQTTLKTTRAASAVPARGRPQQQQQQLPSLSSATADSASQSRPRIAPIEIVSDDSDDGFA
ncbi:double-strand break repair protein mus-23 [Myxozyma melibiosi]|uniref:Double-strand break repair protein mus-23 n=1 Tax=Myxozyma melibiosi TaxID=54550 RepID=A0ABR1FBZ9_9ASCO